MQLETERHQEAERATKVREDMREAHSRLKAIEKELKQLTSNQVGDATILCMLQTQQWTAVS